MQCILVTGALGQIGAELVPTLRSRYGAERVIASDIRMVRGHDMLEAGPFEYLDCTNGEHLKELLHRRRIGTVFHLAAILSAVAEDKPQEAWRINMGGLYAILEGARQHGARVFFPSSIGVFGPGTPTTGTPQVTVQRPTTMYGITKTAGELLCDYYWRRFGVDVRGVRFPGLVSWAAPPGGGTTDYAVHIFHDALRYRRYTCFLSADTRLDMMYMPDALAAMIGVMEADPARLRHRNAFNVTAMSITPAELAAAISGWIPEFRIDYEIDPVRQAIADSWPDAIDDSAAREQWDWSPRYDLAAMTADMLEQLAERLGVPAPTTQ